MENVILHSVNIYWFYANGKVAASFSVQLIALSTKWALFVILILLK